MKWYCSNVPKSFCCLSLFAVKFFEKRNNGRQKTGDLAGGGCVLAERRGGIARRQSGFWCFGIWDFVVELEIYGKNCWSKFMEIDVTRIQVFCWGSINPTVAHFLTSGCWIWWFVDAGDCPLSSLSQAKWLRRTWGKKNQRLQWYKLVPKNHGTAMTSTNPDHLGSSSRWKQQQLSTRDNYTKR